MQQKTVKSPLRYPGGKNRAIKYIDPLLPDFREYREPFVGGGSVFFHVKQKHPECLFRINDLYSKLYHFWRESQRNLPVVVQQTEAWKAKYPEGRKLHRFLLDHISDFTPVEIAAGFFILNRITFSGTSESGGYSQRAFDKRFTPSSIERLRLIDTVLADTQITNLDYAELMNAPGEEVFIFLDPPYYSATKSALYGKNGNLHKGFDHKRFARTAKNCPHKWLITYDDSPYIRELFDFAHILTREWSYGMKNVNKEADKQGKEIFICNYEPQNI